MLSRLLPKSSHFRLIPLLSQKPQLFFSPPPPLQNPNFPSLLRRFSSNHNNNNGKDPPHPELWKSSPNEIDDTIDSLFSVDSSDLPGTTKPDPSIRKEESWASAGGGVVFGRIKSRIQEESGNGGGFDQGNKGNEGDWLSSEGFKPWSLGEEEKDIFNFGEVEQNVNVAEEDKVPEVDLAEQKMRLEQEEKTLTAVIKGPNRAFGDLILASGITDAMLDSLIALRDFEGIAGLPPLSEIEDMRYEKRNKKSSGADLERLKQEEAARARVRKVDDKGRAYGTGKRKCSIARVWIQPGNGNFVVNDKQFDVYFPMIDHRAALLRPLSETKTLGLWDINCTVKGGGVSGQVGAVQLGISRALQNFEPGLRPPLRHGGFLTRDSRIVERKKPGKAKARKSFQWVKR